MPLFYIAFYQLDVVTLRAEIVSLFMSEPTTISLLPTFSILISLDMYNYYSWMNVLVVVSGERLGNV